MRPRNTNKVINTARTKIDHIPLKLQRNRPKTRIRIGYFWGKCFPQKKKIIKKLFFHQPNEPKILKKCKRYNIKVHKYTATTK